MSKNPNPFSNPRSHYRYKSLPNPRSKRLPIIDPATINPADYVNEHHDIVANIGGRERVFKENPGTTKPPYDKYVDLTGLTDGVGNRLALAKNDSYLPDTHYGNNQYDNYKNASPYAPNVDRRALMSVAQIRRGEPGSAFAANGNNFYGVHEEESIVPDTTLRNNGFLKHVHFDNLLKTLTDQTSVDKYKEGLKDLANRGSLIPDMEYTIGKDGKLRIIDMESDRIDSTTRDRILENAPENLNLQSKPPLRNFSNMPSSPFGSNFRAGSLGVNKPPVSNFPSKLGVVAEEAKKALPTKHYTEEKDLISNITERERIPLVPGVRHVNMDLSRIFDIPLSRDSSAPRNMGELSLRNPIVGPSELRFRPENTTSNQIRQPTFTPNNNQNEQNPNKQRSDYKTHHRDGEERKRNLAQGGYVGGDDYVDDGTDLPSLAELIRRQGGEEDTVLAHINPIEAQILKSMGGSGRINETTGLPQYGWTETIGSILGGMVGGPVGSAAGAGVGRMAGGKKKRKSKTDINGTEYDVEDEGDGYFSKLFSKTGDYFDQGKDWLSDPMNLLTVGSSIASNMRRPKGKGGNGDMQMMHRVDESPEEIAAKEKRYKAARRMTPSELAEEFAYKEELERAAWEARNNLRPGGRLNFDPLFRKENDEEERKKKGHWFEYYNNPEFTGEQVYMKRGGHVESMESPVGIIEILEARKHHGDGHSCNKCDNHKHHYDHEDDNQEDGIFSLLDMLQGGHDNHYVDGDSGGQDDEIDARLSPGEYVIDAATVADLGDGNSKNGAKKLDQMRINIRKHKNSGSINKIRPKSLTIESYFR